ncbi:MAG: hypothetical protein RXO36_08355, partial [Candidatus Nanopusillus acidilobi]
LITTPFIGLMVSGILDAILPGCKQKNQTFVLTPRSMSITLPAQELQEPSLITGTTGFETFTIPYEYYLQPFLTYYYEIKSPSTPSFSLQPELSFSYTVLGQASYNNTHASNVGESEFNLSPSLSLSYKIVAPTTISFNLQPQLTLYLPSTQIFNESASSSISNSTATTNSVNESASSSISNSTATTNSVNESASSSISNSTATTNSVNESASSSISNSTATTNSVNESASSSISNSTATTNSVNESASGVPST